jgi:hypothetical protein
MTQLEELLAAAQEALASGNQLVARGYLRRAARVAPDRVDIWRDLLQVTDRRVDRIRCLKHIVALDPEDRAAKEMLADLRRQEKQAQIEDDNAQRAASQSVAAQAPKAADAEAGPTADESEKAVRESGFAGEMPSPKLTGMRPGITDEMRKQWDEAAAAGEPLYCIDHPGRETKLRCNRCGAPVCTSCIVRTPVGFRCKECVKAQQSTFYTARWIDYPIAVAVSLLMSIPAAVVSGIAGWWFAMIISPIAGGLIGGAVHWAIGRRRGRWIWLVVGACVVLGAVIALGALAIFGSRNLISMGIYAVMACGAAVGVLRLGRRRR